MSGAPTILLLEDEPLILMDLDFAAADAGCKCVIAASASQALAQLDTGARPDVAVLDVTLQEGETCIPIARELERRGIPFILHSGDLDRQNENIRALDAKLVPKPANSARVIAAALRLLDGRQGGARRAAAG